MEAKSANTITPATANVEAAAAQPKKLSRKKLATIVVLAIVFNVVVMTVVDQTLLKVRRPKYRLTEINVENLIANNSTNSPSFLMNLDAQITFKNENFGKYDFEFGYLTFSYAGSDVGDVKVERASVKMYSSRSMNLKVNVTSRSVGDKLKLRRDIVSDGVTLKVESGLRGQVLLMNWWKHDRAVELDCSFTVQLDNKSVQHLTCG